MDLQTDVKKIAYVGVFTSVALICSYVEFLLPINFGIPGVKLGLANVITLLGIYLLGWKEALLIQILRVVLSGFLFSSMSALMYSMSGALFSFLIMMLMYKFTKLSIVGVSITGGIFHNIGQLLVAAIIVNQLNIMFYAPVLVLSGAFTGFIIGVISNLIKNKLKHMFDYDSINT